MLTVVRGISGPLRQKRNQSATLESSRPLILQGEITFKDSPHVESRIMRLACIRYTVLVINPCILDELLLE